jgi:SAM-dependent methyltransferase
MNFKRANLAVDALSYETNFFDSVFAFDVLEHFTRQAIDFQPVEVKLPFINLMSEMWRILKPNGKLYALTPFGKGIPRFHPCELYFGRHP